MKRNWTSTFFSKSTHCCVACSPMPGWVSTVNTNAVAIPVSVALLSPWLLCVYIPRFLRQWLVFSNTKCQWWIEGCANMSKKGRKIEKPESLSKMWYFTRRDIFRCLNFATCFVLLSPPQFPMRSNRPLTSQHCQQTLKSPFRAAPAWKENGGGPRHARAMHRVPQTVSFLVVLGILWLTNLLASSLWVDFHAAIF